MKMDAAKIVADELNRGRYTENVFAALCGLGKLNRRYGRGARALGV
jgi:hypothetical protein